MTCTIIMYHYVRNMVETRYPNIHGLTLPKFRAQLEHILRNYTVISLSDYAEHLISGAQIPETPCILTFDDGLKDHYVNVFPELKKWNVPATFFPMNQPLECGVVPSVHKAHFLFAKIGAQTFVDHYNTMLRVIGFPGLATYLVNGKEKQELKYRWDDNLTANLKYSIARLPEEYKKEVLNSIWSIYFQDEKAFVDELYMNINEMREMLEAGMEFGAHTCTHPSLKELCCVDQDYEMSHSKIWLEQALGTGINSISYPYGSHSDKTINLAKKLGYRVGVTTNLGVNEDPDVFRLERMDTNDLPQEAV